MFSKVYKVADRRSNAFLLGQEVYKTFTDTEWTLNTPVFARVLNDKPPELCTATAIHWYIHPIQAAIFNGYHVVHDNPFLFEGNPLGAQVYAYDKGGSKGLVLTKNLGNLQGKYYSKHTISGLTVLNTAIATMRTLIRQFKLVKPGFTTISECRKFLKVLLTVKEALFNDDPNSPKLDRPLYNMAHRDLCIHKSLIPEFRYTQENLGSVACTPNINLLTNKRSNYYSVYINMLHLTDTTVLDNCSTADCSAVLRQLYAVLATAVFTNKATPSDLIPKLMYRAYCATQKDMDKCGMI